MPRIFCFSKHESEEESVVTCKTIRALATISKTASPSPDSRFLSHSSIKTGCSFESGGEKKESRRRQYTWHFESFHNLSNSRSCGGTVLRSCYKQRVRNNTFQGGSERTPTRNTLRNFTGSIPAVRLQPTCMELLG